MLPDTRTPAERIAAVHRATPATDHQRAAAEQLLTDMLTAAEQHGVTLADLDWVGDLPGICLDVVTRRA